MTIGPGRNIFHRGIMTRTTKTLLTLSLISLVVGLTGVSGAIGIPFGAIFLGLSLISRVMQKEAAGFDEERRARLACCEPKRPEEISKPVDRLLERRRRESSFKAHLAAR
jgi:hypothetical protein